MSIRKTALVTGASQGIGLELSRILAQNGYDLVLVSRNGAILHNIAEDFSRQYHVHVHIFTCDLSLPHAGQRIYDFIDQHHWEIDILINNAGIGDWGLFIDSDLARINQLLQINVTALTELTRLFLPGMANRRRGRIMNVSSTAAFQPGPMMSVYFASKAYVLSFSCAIAQEIKGSGVTMTCLCPGPTATGFQETVFSKEIVLTKGRRLPKPQDVAQFGYRAMLKGRRVAVFGLMNQWCVLFIRFLPQTLTLRLVHFLQK